MLLTLNFQLCIELYIHFGSKLLIFSCVCILLGHYLLRHCLLLTQNCAFLFLFPRLIVYGKLGLLLFCGRMLDNSISKSLTTLASCTVSFRADLHHSWSQGSCRSLWTSIWLFRIFIVGGLSPYWSLV